jgi:hypothetical protein
MFFDVIALIMEKSNLDKLHVIVEQIDATVDWEKNTVVTPGLKSQAFETYSISVEDFKKMNILETYEGSAPLKLRALIHLQRLVRSGAKDVNVALKFQDRGYLYVDEVILIYKTVGNEIKVVITEQIATHINETTTTGVTLLVSASGYLVYKLKK